METGNIIAVYNKNKRTALREFELLLDKTNGYLNLAAREKGLFRKCDAKVLEKEVVNAMKDQCGNTVFTPDDIQLVSGQRFPDIVAGKHFGVEVKSTKENKWTSTGSSIVESTRVDDVDYIYMLFGKLGGNPAEFMCKPYQDCLYDIAVTHSPRYLIDMNIPREETIFSKMGVNYDGFRLSEDPIGTVRSYYAKKIKEKKQKAMPWWMGKDTVAPPTLRIWSCEDMTIEEKNRYKAEMLILFPEEICNSNYDNATLWLCVRHSLINTHFRDLYTAGGQKEINGVKCPAIISRIIQLAPLVKEALRDPDFWPDIKDYNPRLFDARDRYACWVNQVAEQYPKIKDLRDWLMSV